MVQVHRARRKLASESLGDKFACGTMEDSQTLFGSNRALCVCVVSLIGKAYVPHHVHNWLNGLHSCPTRSPITRPSGDMTSALVAPLRTGQNRDKLPILNWNASTGHLKPESGSVRSYFDLVLMSCWVHM